MSDKEAKLYYSIADASLQLSLPKYVIRFWEAKFYQISPMKRAGGRRYFRPEDMKILLLIKTLLYKHGLTIKGVQNLLKGKTISHLLNDMYNDMLEKNILSSSNIDDNSDSLPNNYSLSAIKDILVELISIRKQIN